MKFSKQISNLEIPLPEKLKLEKELSHHEHHHLTEGPLFSDNDKALLFDVHNTPLYKWLRKQNLFIQKQIEIGFIAIPLVTLTLSLGKENFMIQFIKEGGFGMIPILALTLTLMFQELLRLFRLIILKDHRPQYLKPDSLSVFVACFALFLLGIAGTCLGLYVSANASLETGASGNLFFIGFKESLGPIILGAASASTVLILHFTCRQILFRWQSL